MSKKMLLGLGAVAGACFMVSKKLTEEQREKIAMKVDEIILDGRDKALKYDYYAREFIKENNFGGLKDRIVEKTRKYASDNKSVDDALESLKRATKDLKDHLEETGKNLKDLADVETEDVEIGYDEPEDDWNDDIIINGNTDSAFGEAKKAGDENATITFYPHKKD